MPALTNDGQPIVVPEWWYAAGPADKRMLTKAAKVKKGKKKARKDARLAKLAAVARDRSLPTDVRLRAITIVDEAIAGKSALKEGELVLTKRAKKRMERQALTSSDVHVRQRALDAMFPW